MGDAIFRNVFAQDQKNFDILILRKGERNEILDQMDKFTIILHDDKKFHDLNLAKDMKDDIRSAEQDTKGKLQGEN